MIVKVSFFGSSFRRWELVADVSAGILEFLTPCWWYVQIIAHYELDNPTHVALLVSLKEL